MTVRRWLTPLLGVALVLTAWAAPSASAQEADAEAAPSERLVLRGVDASEPGTVRAYVAWSGDPDDLGGLELRLDGEQVPVELQNLAQAGLRNDIAIVVDTSATTDNNGLLTMAKRALRDLVDALPQGVRAAVVTAGPTSQTMQRLTDDHARLRTAIDDLTPAGEGGVLAGILRGAALVKGEGVLPTVVLITDGVSDSTTTAEMARGALVDAGAALHVVGLQDGSLDEGMFADLAAGSGGRFLLTDDPGDIPGLVVDELQPELVQLTGVTYESTADRGVQRIVVSVGDVSVEGSYIAGGNLVGAQRVHPRPAVEPGGIAFFRSDAGWILGLALAVVAAGLFAYGIFSLFTKEDRLSSVLQPYADGYVAEGDDMGDGSAALAQTAFLQRAVAFTEQIAERQGLLARIEKKLEKADLPLRAGEALFFYCAGVVVAFALFFALAGNPVGALAVTVVAALLPPGILEFLGKRKKRQFEALLPDTLQLLSSTLRAGYSIMQGVEAVSEEAAEPMGKELRRVVTEARLGRSLEESLDAVAERMESPDFAWAVMAIRIQREVGGNLAELLLTVAETMTERERLRRDVNALTAEGRMSAYVLIGLPIGLTFFLYSINPDYMGTLFDRTIGQMMLGAAAVMMTVGYVWMKKIITIEI